MSSTTAFVGSIPETYDRCLGPLLFEPFARDLITRLDLQPRARVLELACGTGVATGAIARALPADALLVATDLHGPMLVVARRRVPRDSRLRLARVDACRLPLHDRSYERLVCQFGVMFFPDKEGAMREARRVLVRGGRYVFSVWDSLAANDHARIVHETVARHFPADPPRFLTTPYGWFDRAEIARVVEAAGLTLAGIDAVELPAISASAEDAARGFVEGTPLLAALRDRGVTDPAPIRGAVAEALARSGDDRPCRGRMRAFVCTAVNA